MSQLPINLPSKDGEPTWEAAYFFPPQGRWSEELFLQFHTNLMAELVNGRSGINSSAARLTNQCGQAGRKQGNPIRSPPQETKCVSRGYNR